MAEIPIERKKSTNWIPLIVGLLLVVALVAWWRSRDGNDTNANAATADTSAAVTGSDTAANRR